MHALPTPRERSLWLALAGLAAGFGVLTAVEPSMAIVLAIVFALGVFCLANGRVAWWGLLLVALSGSLVLGYAFANVGVRLPRGRFLSRMRSWSSCWPGCCLQGVPPFPGRCRSCSLRASRPSRPFASGPCRPPQCGQYRFDISRCHWIGCLIGRVPGDRRYAGTVDPVPALGVPVRTRLFRALPLGFKPDCISPVVGLDQSVPLLGTYQGAGTAASAALFFFALVRPFGRLSYLLASLCLPVIALTQARGLYIAVPAALLVLWLAVGRPRPSVAGSRSPRLRARGSPWSPRADWPGS